MPLTIFGGIKPENKKYSRSRPLEAITPPDNVFIPVDESDRAVVAAGETVGMGQPVAYNRDDIPLCSSVSGEVKGIAAEGDQKYIAIENDKKNNPYINNIQVNKPLGDLSFKEITELLKQYAVMDCFDKTYACQKLTQATDLKRIIINCCESDSYSTALYRLLTEHPGELIGGAKILMHALSIRKCVLVIEEKKQKAFSQLKDYINDPQMFVNAVIENKYPVNEKTIMSAIYGKEIPHKKSAVDLGYIIFGAEAVIQIYNSFVTGMPQVSKILTVSGESIAKPSNLIVPLGTPIKNLISECGNLIHRCRCVINGGIMDGECLETPGGVVTALTNQLLLLRWIEKYNGSCVRCGRCITVCPMYLSPMDYAAEAGRKKVSGSHGIYYGIDACIECGCCEYICPSGVPLLEIIRDEKERKRTARKYESNCFNKTDDSGQKPDAEKKINNDENSGFFIPF